MVTDEDDDGDGWDDWDDEDDSGRWLCIGADCCNPHITHMRAECFTAEMAEAYHSAEETRGND
jgi:hypothetical protein